MDTQQSESVRLAVDLLRNGDRNGAALVLPKKPQIVDYAVPVKKSKLHRTASLTLRESLRNAFARFIAKVKISESRYSGTPCWEWQGAKGMHGYGQFLIAQQDHVKLRTSS
jgi:hypothetical protein